MKNTKYKILLFALAFVFLQCGLGQKELPDTSKASELIVDSLAAEKIAVTAWFNVYGNKILQDTPYVFQQLDSKWVVSGTLGPGLKGGVPYIEISKKDGKVIRISHTK
jgi:NTF2 fold immunity protein